MISLSFSYMFLILFIFADYPGRNEWLTNSIIFSTSLLGYLDNAYAVILSFLKYASFQLRIILIYSIPLNSNRYFFYLFIS